MLAMFLTFGRLRLLPLPEKKLDHDINVRKSNLLSYKDASED